MHSARTRRPRSDLRSAPVGVGELFPAAARAAEALETLDRHRLARLDLQHLFVGGERAPEVVRRGGAVGALGGARVLEQELDAHRSRGGLELEETTSGVTR